MLVRDKNFYKTLLKLTVPIALQNLISLGMNLSDTVMLGSLGEKQISASALANQPFFVFTLVMFGLCSGACVLTAQYWGKSDTETINKIVALALKISAVCSVLFSALVLIFPEFVISLYTADREVIRLGAQFLRIIGFSYTLSAISTTYLYILRSIEIVTLPLTFNFISFSINIFLNWIFIYGHFGFPAMGIRGSATGTLCARIIEICMVLVYAIVFNRKIRLRLGYIVRTDLQLLRDFLRYSAPVVINETLWSLGISMQSVVIGHMGSRQVAASSIAGVVQRLCMVIVFGMSNAAAIIVGKQIGAGEEEKAGRSARTMLLLSVVIGILSAGIILLIREPMIAFYNVDQTTKQYASEFIEVYAVVLMFMSFNSVNIVGVLRGGGDTRFAMFIDTFALWLFAIPLGALAGLYFKFPLPVVFFLLTCDEVVKFTIGIWRFRSGKWLRNLTR